MQLTSLVCAAVYQATEDEGLAGQLDIKSQLETLGKSLSAGAFADGRQGAKVIDFVVETAIDIGLEVATGGAAEGSEASIRPTKPRRRR